MTIVSRTFTFNVTPASTGPTWFTALPYNTWTSLGNTLDSAAQRGTYGSVTYPPFASNKTTDDITGAGNGAGMDQVNKEMLIVNTGGHSGWWGGDGYRLILTESTPRWERLTSWLPSYKADVAWLAAGDSVTNQQAYQDWTLLQGIDYGQGIGSGGQWIDADGISWDRYDWPATFVDGVTAGERVAEWLPWETPDRNDIMERPRAPHTCYSIHYSNGSMWYPTQCGTNAGSGRGSRVPYSCDVDFLRAHLASTGTPYEQGFGDKIPWTYYNPPDSRVDPITFPISAIDTGTGRIWTQNTNTTRFFWLGTTGTEAGQGGTYTLPFNAERRFTNGPSAICPDVGRRMWVAVSTLVVGTVPANEIVVYDLAQIESGTALTGGTSQTDPIAKVIVPNLDTLAWARNRTAEEARKGYGMVWHRPSLAFLVFNCDESPRTASTSTIFKIHPPLYGDGTWNKSGAWSVSTVTVSGVPAITSSAANGIQGSSFSRFNIINDMGNGESLLISQGNVLSQASFLRFQVAGSATIAWTAPTTNTSGQTLDGSTNDRILAGYRIYYGTNQSQVLAGTSAVQPVAAGTTNYTINGLTAGTWYFRIVAIDADGDESNTGASATTYTKVIT